MKILLTLAAAALTTAALSLPASAGQIGCDPSDDMASLKATQCEFWSYGDSFAAPAAEARAYAPRAHATRRAHAAPRAYASDAYASEYTYAPWLAFPPMTSGYPSSGYTYGPPSHY